MPSSASKVLEIDTAKGTSRLLYDQDYGAKHGPGLDLLRLLFCE